MTVSAKYAMICQATESRDLGDAVGHVNITHDFSRLMSTVEDTLTANSTVPVTRVWSDTLALVGGALTLDLTGLSGPYSSTTTFLTLKVQIVCIANPATATGALEVDVGASNGYNLFGEDNTKSDQVLIPPGGAVMFFGNNALADVAANEKNVDFVGTGTESFHILMVAG